MFILSTYTFISLPRTPDCVMAEARITQFFGETQIREEVLDFMGLGSCMPREAWRLPSPHPLQKNSADAKATKAVSRPADGDDAQTAGLLLLRWETSAGAKVQGINMMKVPIHLDSYKGYNLGFPMDPMEPPSPSCGLATTTATTTPSANRTSRRVNSSPWVGWPSGGRHPKRARVALGRK